VEFTGKWSGDDVILNWTTASELNNSHFNVRRSTDGETYREIGISPSKAPNGTSNDIITYDYLDTEVENYKYAPIYYRLEQEDFDGTKELSKAIVLVRAKPLIASMNIQPNPVEGVTSVGVDGLKNVNTKIVVYDLYGKALNTAEVLPKQGIINQEFDFSDYAAGMYFIKVFNDGTLITKPWVKN
jgi:hypothetical protein